MEYNFQGGTFDHLPVCLDFRSGKLYPNERPGLVMELDPKPLRRLRRSPNRGQRVHKPTFDPMDRLQLVALLRAFFLAFVAQVQSSLRLRFIARSNR